MIWCLPGFLGRSEDWTTLLASLKGNYIHAVDLFAQPIETTSIEEWASSFVAEVQAHDPHPILLGYSLGGRLALHTLLAAPNLFKKAVIVSAGLGIEGEENRRERREIDESWARRFVTEAWTPLIDSWNRQHVFASSRPLPVRSENDFSRLALATALRSFSPGVQQPLFERLSLIAVPLLWAAGERDTRYVEEAQRAMSQLPNAELFIVPNAGHRAPWDEPEQFVMRMHQFLEIPLSRWARG